MSVTLLNTTCEVDTNWRAKVESAFHDQFILAYLAAQKEFAEPAKCPRCGSRMFRQVVNDRCVGVKCLNRNCHVSGFYETGVIRK